MDELRFSIPEILSLIGITQYVYVLVYIFMRGGRSPLPTAYFLVLAMAFLSDFASSYLGSATVYYFYFPWLFWFLGPPLSILMALQIARIDRVLVLKYYILPFLLPLAALLAWAAFPEEAGCRHFVPCPSFQPWLILSGVVVGALSLLGFWINRRVFPLISEQKLGKERYWLILALFFTNIFFLMAMLASLSGQATHEEVLLIRSILGLAFVYLVSTSLFRLYPQGLKSTPAALGKSAPLTPEEQETAEKIKSLLEIEKVYQEGSYSRSDLARECNVSETTISRVIAQAFQKSYPQLMNEYRVKDAERLLRQTDASINTIAFEIGFSSVASFNRVFKQLTGSSPSQYRSLSVSKESE